MLRRRCGVGMLGIAAFALIRACLRRLFGAQWSCDFGWLDLASARTTANDRDRNGKLEIRERGCEKSELWTWTHALHQLHASWGCCIRSSLQHTVAENSDSVGQQGLSEKLEKLGFKRQRTVRLDPLFGFIYHLCMPAQSMIANCLNSSDGKTWATNTCRYVRAYICRCTCCIIHARKQVSFWNYGLSYILKKNLS